MPEYTVYLNVPASCVVKVESDLTPEDDEFNEELHLKAAGKIGGLGICCSGYGKDWSLDIETTATELNAVWSDGKELWNENGEPT